MDEAPESSETHPEEPMSHEEPMSQEGPMPHEGQLTIEKPKKKQLSQAKLDQLRKAREAKRLKRELVKQQREASVNVHPTPEPVAPPPVMNIVEKPKPRKSKKRVSLSPKTPPPPTIVKLEESEEDDSEEDDESESDLSTEEEEPPQPPPRRRRAKSQREVYYEQEAHPPQTSYNQPTERDIYLDNLRKQMFGPVL